MQNNIDPDQIYTAAVQQAADALGQGTFAVGGLLMRRGGEILKTIRNDVIRNGYVYDPTAHVERQLIDWYHSQKNQDLDPPPPEECVIVSSLDPCIMCGGAALASGIQVVTANLDPFVSVNWKGDMNFEAVPETLKEKAKEIFAYMGVRAPDPVPYRGSMRHIFSNAAVGLDIVEKSERHFLDSVVGIRALINSSDQQDPKIYKSAPTSKHIHLVEEWALKAEQSGHRRQAGLLIGPDGRVLYNALDLTSISPIATPMMQVMRGYMKKRWEDISRGGRQNLPHPKHCVYLQFYGPGEDATDLSDIGAFGSTMEGPLPEGNKAAFQFIHDKVSPARLAELIQNLPPYYREFVGIQPVKVSLG